LPSWYSDRASSGLRASCSREHGARLGPALLARQQVGERHARARLVRRLGDGGAVFALGGLRILVPLRHEAERDVTARRVDPADRLGLGAGLVGATAHEPRRHHVELEQVEARLDVAAVQFDGALERVAHLRSPGGLREELAFSACWLYARPSHCHATESLGLALVQASPLATASSSFCTRSDARILVGFGRQVFGARAGERAIPTSSRVRAMADATRCRRRARLVLLSVERATRGMTAPGAEGPTVQDRPRRATADSHTG
jgi:hypothetical protein